MLHEVVPHHHHHEAGNAICFSTTHDHSAECPTAVDLCGHDEDCGEKQSCELNISALPKSDFGSEEAMLPLIAVLPLIGFEEPCICLQPAHWDDCRVIDVSGKLSYASSPLRGPPAA